MENKQIFMIFSVSFAIVIPWCIKWVALICLKIGHAKTHLSSSFFRCFLLHIANWKFWEEKVYGIIFFWINHVIEALEWRHSVNKMVFASSACYLEMLFFDFQLSIYVLLSNQTCLMYIFYLGSELIAIKSLIPCDVTNFTKITPFSLF